MVWLCAEHQKHDGITVLSDDVADTTIVSQDAGVDVNSAFQDFTSDANQCQKGSDAAKRPSTAKGDYLYSWVECRAQSRSPSVGS